jgi:hypothetical protein
MQTSNTSAIVRLSQSKGFLKACLFGNPGPFPFGAPGTMGKAQYVGIADHLVLTLMEDRYLAGLLSVAADVPMTPSGETIYWCGGVQAQPWMGDIYYMIHPLFIRDAQQLLAEAKNLQLEAHITGINGRVSHRQYWLVEIPSITENVLLNLDEITIVQRRAKWAPKKGMTSRVTRGEFWQTGGFQEHPAYAVKRGEGEGDGHVESFEDYR